MKKINNLALVDDDEAYTYVTRAIIQKTNLVGVIKIFNNGKEAIDFLELHSKNLSELPEVILLDLSMPIMDGWQFLEEFAALKPRIGKKITIYVVSSSISPADIKRAAGISEVSDYIIKPITQERLIAMLETL